MLTTAVLPAQPPEPAPAAPARTEVLEKVDTLARLRARRSELARLAEESAARRSERERTLEGDLEATRARASEARAAVEELRRRRDALREERRRLADAEADLKGAVARAEAAAARRAQRALPPLRFGPEPTAGGSWFDRARRRLSALREEVALGRAVEIRPGEVSLPDGRLLPAHLLRLGLLGLWWRSEDGQLGGHFDRTTGRFVETADAGQRARIAAAIDRARGLVPPGLVPLALPARPGERER